MSGAASGIELFTLIEKKDRHFMFPATGRLPGGKFALLFHDAPARSPIVNHDPEMSLEIMTGDTPWKPEKKTLRQIPRFTCAGAAPSITTLPCGEAAIMDSSWHILNWMGEQNVRVMPHYDWVVLLRGAHVIITDSSTGKLRFSKPRRVCSLSYPVLVCNGPLIPESDSSFFCAADYNYECTMIEDKPWEVVVMATENQGESWDVRSGIYFEKDQNDLPKLLRPYVTRTEGEGLVCALGSTIDSRNIFLSFSDDSGRTWSKPGPSGLNGNGYSILRLNDGRLLLLYSPQNNPKSISCRISDDGGRSWPENTETIIDDRSVEPGFGRPRAIQLEDGSIFAVYYFLAKKNRINIYGARFTV